MNMLSIAFRFKCHRAPAASGVAAPRVAFALLFFQIDGYTGCHMWQAADASG
jgi:hypothetical protein